MHELLKLKAIILLQFILFLNGECYYGDADTLSDAFHIQSLNGEVDAGNFSYYKLSLEGSIYLKLVSKEGDADLYASTDTLTPTWEDYTMKSDTCSVDLIAVQPYDPRPVGVGVYGYINFPSSKYELHVYRDTSQFDFFQQASGNDVSGYGFQEDNSVNDHVYSNTGENDESTSYSSLLLNLFFEILTIMFDILL